MNNNNNKYRWIALVVALLINLCIGSVYAWSVFANPLAEVISAATGTQITSLSIVFTVANAVGPITMISGGFINDKIGSRWLIFIGGILFGAGMIGAGFARSVPMLIISYGLGVGLAIGMIYGCTVSSTIKLFPDKRGLAGGLSTAAYGISSVVVPPVANALIEKVGVSNAMKIIGLVMMIIIIVCGFIFAACFNKYTSGMEKSSSAAAAEGMNWKQMLATPYFYVMIIMICAGAFSGLMITSQASPLAQKIFSAPAATAAVIVSVLALFNTAGRLLSGAVSDKIGIINTLRITFVLFMISQMILFLSANIGSLALFIVGVCGVGLCFGSIMGIYPSFTARRFGAAHNSVNYGIMFCGFALAGYLGPMMLNSIYNSTGAYNLAFIIAAAFACAGLVLTFIKEKGGKRL